MAAADEEEGQSENKKDDIFSNARTKQFTTMQQDFEAKLTRSDSNYERRVSIILSGWDRLTGASSAAQLPFATFLYRWTLQLILQGEWPKLEKIVKTRLGATLQRCIRDPVLAEMATKLHPLVTDPWGNTTLKAILAESKVSQEDVAKYINEESWEVIRVRVDTMMDSKCEALALSVLQACLRCLPPNDMSSVSTLPELSEVDKHHFIDLNLVLVYKFSKQQFLEKVKEMDVEQGVAFVRRLLVKEVKAKIWKNKLKITHMATQVFLASCIVKSFTTTFRLVFSEWCAVMKATSVATELLVQMVRKYIQLAESSQHIYTMASVLHQILEKDQAALVTELLIRALTLDMNSVERVKSEMEDGADVSGEHIKHEQQMASGFMDLSSVFRQHDKVARECVLTAFSLHPTEERLQALKSFAFPVSPEPLVTTTPADDKQPLSTHKTNSLIDKIYSDAPCPSNESEEKEDSMEAFLVNTESLIEQLNEYDGVQPSSHADILTAPQEVLNSELLGLSKELCDDLAVVVSSPRWQVLSWMLDPKKLIIICEQYFIDSDRAKNITKELKFLNIDYEQFRHLPSADVDEFTGIEKGYEHFMEESDFETGEESSQPHSSADVDHPKRTRTKHARRSKVVSRAVGSDSDSTLHKHTSSSGASVSDSDDTDLDYMCKTTIRTEKGFEGKRVTSVSNCDKRKRLRVDRSTGKVKSSRHENNSLRLYRHASSSPKIFGRSPSPQPAQRPHEQPPAQVYTPPPQIGRALTIYRRPATQPVTKDFQFVKKQDRPLVQKTIPVTPIGPISKAHPTAQPVPQHKMCCSHPSFSSQNKLARPISKVKLPSPDVTISSFSRRSPSSVQNSYKNTKYFDCSLEKSILKSHLELPPIKTERSFKPLEYVSTRAPLNKDQAIKSEPNKHQWKYSGYVVAGKSEGPSQGAPSPQPVTCTYRTREGQIVNLNYGTTIVKPSRYEESFTKFLSEQSKANNQVFSPWVTITRNKKTTPYEHSVLKKAANIKEDPDRCQNRSSYDLAVAQKRALNRIMSPEHRKSINLGQLMNTIAMPVSHTPPNLPTDKTSPTGLSRVLPKGTTVVRKPKTEGGAGPSGMHIANSTTSVLNPLRNAVSITPRRVSNSSDILYAESDSSRRTVPRSQNNALVETNAEVLTMQSADSSSPLASATVAVNVPSQRTNSLMNTPGEISGGVIGLAYANNRSSDGLTISHTTTTVANVGVESRGTSMLESLLRDRATPGSPLLSSAIAASTVTTTALHDPLVAASSAVSGISNSPGTVCVTGSSGQPAGVSSLSNTFLSRIAGDSRSVAVGAESLGSLHHNSVVSENNSGLSVILSGSSSTGTNTLALPRGVASSLAGQANLIAASSSASTPNSMHQLVLPAQFIQVQGSDGLTGLGIVHSGSLDLRLPPGTRVIKSSNASVTQPTSIAGSPATSRQLNVLHNLKIVQPNRPIVRTVVVPHSAAIPNLSSHQPTQLVSLAGPASHMQSDNAIVGNKIQQTQLQKLLGHNVVPGGLVIRAVRPTGTADSNKDPQPLSRPTIRSADDPKSGDLVKIEKNIDVYKPRTVPVSSHCEGLGERLSRHFLKNAITQSVGTQTQTTAVKPATGQIVSQVLMNPLRVTNSTSAMSNLPVVSHASNQDISPLNLAPVNSVSSETLEQLREFESVFEKVSNKSGKENEIDTCPQNFPNTSISSEESMIAAQLLSMANETPVSTSSTFICSMPMKTPDTVTVTTSSPSPVVATITSSVANVTPHISEGAFLNTQTGTIILVNPANVSGVTAVQPPPPDSPGLSSTSSHSSVASSPCSTPSKLKKPPAKPTVITQTNNAVVPPRPKSPPPPPPKVPPKPAVAKPQVEESDEIKARIQSILDQYKQDLANTPQPQPAPRNRKNCPPPKTEGKSSSKKKSQVKKSDGTSTSPGSVDGSHLPSVSSSPAALSVSTPGEDSDGSGAGSSTSNRYSIMDEKSAPDDSSPSILQTVVVPNLKTEGTNTATLTSLPQALAGGRVFQLVRHGNKVTAITTQQPYQKLKSGLSATGAPPNVTIQGRINVNELMEGHLTSILTGAAAAGAVNPGSSLIAKLLQPQQTGAVQQIVIQPSRQHGEHIIQQLTIPHTIQTQIKAPMQIANQTVNAAAATVTPTTPQLPSKTQSTFPASPQSNGSSSPPFPNIEEDTSNSSEQSQDGPGRLPPFFTLTKQFMVPGSSKQKDTNSVIKKANPVDGDVKPSQSKSSSIGTSSFVVTDMQYPKEDDMLDRNHTDSPIIVARDALLEISSRGTASSIDAAPVALRTLHDSGTVDLRGNSMDSMLSEISTEEVQIPPSPATLTKQLQNAYMTEAALSPAISQSQLSSHSSYSSPATVHELQFLDTNSQSPNFSPTLNQNSHRFTTAGPSGTSRSILNTSTSNGLTNARLACLSSPSGDVYLDQAGLGLDSLPMGDDQSPSLSDLVPAVPLLSWSPRSANSLMEQSPSFNETIAGGIHLDHHHSEDSLCDSSTGFPVLFSMEPDGASSSASDDLGMIRTTNASSSAFVSESVATTTTTTSPHNDSIRLYQSREQDQTVSSTRIETRMRASPSMPLIDTNNTDSSSMSWRFGNTYMDRSQSRRDSNRMSRSSNTELSERRRSQRQSGVEKLEDKSHNGLDNNKPKLEELKQESPSSRSTRSRRSVTMPSCTSPDIKMVKDDPESLDKKPVKQEEFGESSHRLTRGSKRRSETYLQDDRSCRSPYPPKFDDKSPEDAEVAHFSKALRGRNISGTSDSSSNLSTPGPQDSPNANGGAAVRKRKRRVSQDSSISSRDGSPLLSGHQDSVGANVVHARRSSSREQSKKSRCVCCVDPAQPATHATSSRRLSSRGKP